MCNRRTITKVTSWFDFKPFFTLIFASWCLITGRAVACLPLDHQLLCCEERLFKSELIRTAAIQSWNSKRTNENLSRPMNVFTITSKINVPSWSRVELFNFKLVLYAFCYFFFLLPRGALYLFDCVLSHSLSDSTRCN